MFELSTPSKEKEEGINGVSEVDTAQSQVATALVTLPSHENPVPLTPVPADHVRNENNENGGTRLVEKEGNDGGNDLPIDLEEEPRLCLGATRCPYSEDASMPFVDCKHCQKRVHQRCSLPLKKREATTGAIDYHCKICMGKYDFEGEKEGEDIYEFYDWAENSNFPNPKPTAATTSNSDSDTASEAETDDDNASMESMEEEDEEILESDESEDEREEEEPPATQIFS